MTKVLLVFGGEGSEHEVSIMSAGNVAAALEEANLEFDLAYIAKDGKWFSANTVSNLDEKNLQKFSFDKIDCDVIFPLIHGKGGEDGALASLGQLLHIPVVGCGVAPSTIAWDKDLCKQVLLTNDVPVVPWLTVRQAGDLDFNTAKQKLKTEIMFVKPAREGSSVGVSRVDNESDFDKAIVEALRYDDKVLVELAVGGRELECAVLGNQNNIQTTVVGEIIYGTTEFYDYDAKYSEQSSARTVIPANDIPDLVVNQIQNYAKEAFVAIGGNGLSRIDFFYSNDGNIYVNEINTMPGFTNISMYPKLWQQKGITYPQLISKLIELAIDRINTTA